MGEPMEKGNASPGPSSARPCRGESATIDARITRWARSPVFEGDAQPRRRVRRVAYAPLSASATTIGIAAPSSSASDR